jgi:hypothetical protein
MSTFFAVIDRDLIRRFFCLPRLFVRDSPINTNFPDKIVVNLAHKNRKYSVATPWLPAYVKESTLERPAMAEMEGGSPLQLPAIPWPIASKGLTIEDFPGITSVAAPRNVR